MDGTVAFPRGTNNNTHVSDPEERGVDLGDEQIAMDKVLDERLEHGALAQPGTPFDQRLQLIEPIDDHLPNMSNA
jgi:hypothetical protein